MDLPTLRRAYDNTAAEYDARFRDLQRVKYRAGAELLSYGPHAGPGALCVDAGGGTALWTSFLRDEGEPWPEVRAGLLSLRWLVLDASVAMLRIAAVRNVACVAADLARAPLRPGSAALVIAFTSVLGQVEASLQGLSALLAPGGRLLVSFLAAEAPALPLLARASGLAPMADPRQAGQDLLFLLGKNRG